MAIVLFAGDKGGVGKSMGCMSFIEWSLARAMNYELIEGDTSNDNVYKSYKNAIESHRFNLGVSDGWREMTDLIETKKDINLVVNTPARIDEIIRKEAEILETVCKALDQKICIFWMINRQRDSVVSFKRAKSIFKNSPFIVVKNLYFGDAKKFVIWDESEVKKQFDQEGGITLEYPELNDRAIDRVVNPRLTFSGAIAISEAENDKLGNSKIMISDKTDIQRWLKSINTLFDSVEGLA